ncbi:hypothetical protein [Kitasatospora cathayae]|uniref:Sulfatase-modifying factor enzyme domain-containing protein n=1 Tax=Kitasatospora cathayae TaxID=3004092 RepID=A0ABY7QBJ6_9ACTN|nr:hypothetical protein [Kitasatospora sp. HUAS 3-15]WBP90077.1 hypothetical protein O1G21_32305 [Kitasatospora sp. HUAS 3-15]
MLRITADVYSGRPNPVADITDEAEVRATLSELTRDRTLFVGPRSSEAQTGGLGLRGFWVETFDDGLARDFDLESRVFLPAGPQAPAGRAAEVAERLITTADWHRAPDTFAGTTPPIGTSSFREFLLGQLASGGRASVADRVEPAGGEQAESPAVTCQIELGAFNPGFWNNDPNVMSSNNCYNYASNWRTNTFAQPGRGCGNMYTQITCDEVTRAALCDGMHHRFDCFPDTEKPRFLVALVVIPGGGDYHWYRKHVEGFWGHKPGPTAARNVDNSGNVIFNPETADRGPYTIFCGYFYGCDSQRKRIN